MTAKTNLKIDCVWCETMFVPERAGGLYCKDACRVAGNRAGYSGLTRETIYALRYGEEADLAFKKENEKRLRRWSEEQRKISAGAYPDEEDRLEAAENRYWNWRYDHRRLPPKA